MVVEQLILSSENSQNSVTSECFNLQRYPLRKKEGLRAWDAADEYLLNHLAENDMLADDSALLIINDSFGGLSIPLSRYHPVVMTDSYLSALAIEKNAVTNHLPEAAITIVDSLHLPENTLGPAPDFILLKIPKNLSLLEDQLHRVRHLMKAGARLIAAGMSKHIHKSTLALFERIIGTTTTSLAQKKARLIFSQYDAALSVGENPYPLSYPLDYKLDGEAIVLSNHASVFSTARLDIGTRFFLEKLPVEDRYHTIVDLGCGNGVLGLFAAIKNPQAKLVFTDESYMAVESAISNFISVFAESREVEFLQTDCLQGVSDGTVSLILCNPPFHQNNAINDHIAWQMFTESKAALENKGELWVIGNRHLAYHAKLKKIFGNCETVASNKKFTLLKAVVNH